MGDQQGQRAPPTNQLTSMYEDLDDAIAAKDALTAQDQGVYDQPNAVGLDGPDDTRRPTTFGKDRAVSADRVAAHAGAPAPAGLTITSATAASVAPAQKFPWLHEGLSRQEAEALLSQFVDSDGTYLVRDRAQDSYALSMIFNRAISHHLLKKDVSGFWLVNEIKYEPACTELGSLIMQLRTRAGHLMPAPISNFIAADTDA